MGKNEKGRKSSLSYFLAFIAVIIIPGIIFSLLLLYAPKNDLPIYSAADMNPELVDPSLFASSKKHKVLDFELVNQNGILITQEDYKNKVYVVDFIFTSCPTICPVMSNNLKKVQDEFEGNNKLKLLSVSVTPMADSVPILREYANEIGANDSVWNICTGDKKHIYTLARNSYFVAMDKGDGGAQDFIHSANLVLVDRRKQIRGVYIGTKDSEIDRLIKDIQSLIH